MQSWMSWLGCIWVLRFILVSIHLLLSISSTGYFFPHTPTCWYCTLYRRHFKIQCTLDSCYFIVYSCAMCKLRMISCFTKTELYWNFIYSIWTVWFVCSKLHNWLHSDFQAFFLVSWYYGVYQDWPLLFDFLFLWLRNVISSGWGSIYLMTCSCSWPAGCRGSHEESWSSSEASCWHRFRSGADERPRAVPTRALGVRQQHLLRWLDAAMGTLESMVCPASWKTVKRLDRFDKQNIMYYGMYGF